MTVIYLLMDVPEVLGGPDYIAIVIRKDITLISYKKAFIEILFGQALTNNAVLNRFLA